MDPTVARVESSTVSPPPPPRDLGVEPTFVSPSKISHVPSPPSLSIDELRNKRTAIDEQIDQEAEKAKVQSDSVLSKRLATLNESIARKLAANDYDKTIQEARLLT